MEQDQLNTNSDENQQNDISFVQMEHEVLKFWQKEKIFEASLEQTRKAKPYIFYDGPPFATGLPHHGHLVGSTLKDIVPRFFTMKGYFVDRRFGWDCHGLPIEYEIDKSLGMSTHEAIKKIGIKGYNDQCRGIVQRYTSEWKKTIDRIGRWVDFDRDYKTMDTTFMESTWWVFKQLWDKNLIYQSVKVMPFSTALSTPLSNFEASSNYQEVQDPAITVVFKISHLPNTYIAAWTTTPWTLPSNLGLCVHPELEYVEVYDEDKKFNLILVKDRLEVYKKNRKLEIKNTYKGVDLKGWKYEPLFPYFQELKSIGAFQIHNDDYVTTTDGTGIVHLASAFGEDDHRVLKKVSADLLVCPVDDQGKFTKDVTDFAGQYIKDADKEIIKYLKNKNSLYEQSTLNHSYPFCPRSKTPLIYKAIPSWFVKVEAIKDKIIKANQEINWVPNHLQQGRFGQWLENARDWAISRNRVWGTPLPIWINDENGKMICFGSIQDLKAKTGVELKDLHREFVDDLTFTLPNEAGTYRRVKEVLDCWFESGSMPYSQIHYPFENQEHFKAGFPAEFIAEGLDQTRGWFYTLTVLSAALFDKPAFKNVIVNGLVLAQDGKKMSKSLRNYTAPDVLMENYGADALRLCLINSGLVKAEDLRFSDAGVKEMVRRVLLPWYNSFKFFKTYAEIDQWKPLKVFKPEHILDRWIYSKLQTLISQVDQEMQQYHLYNVVPHLFSFIDDLTNWYIRLNRRRFWDEDSQDKNQAYQTLYVVLDTFSKIMAPFTPFLSESLFKELKSFSQAKEKSVHLCSFPIADKNAQDQELESAVLRMQQVVLMGRQIRNNAKIKVKIPLNSLTLILDDESILQKMRSIEASIKTELNVKNVIYESKEDQYISLVAKPNFPVLGKKVGAEMPKFSKFIATLSAKDIKDFERTGKLNHAGFDLTKEDIVVSRTAKNGKNVQTDTLISIMMDTELNQELIDEGMARDLISLIQKARKDLKFHVADRIHLFVAIPTEKINFIKKYQNYITQETLSKDITLQGNKDNHRSWIDAEIDDNKFFISLAKA
jgi:isoleucyl-tRNA synthetase